jgi:hypothetical protein
MSEINESKTIGQEEEQHTSFKTQVELVDNSHSYQRQKKKIINQSKNFQFKENHQYEKTYSKTC